MRIINRRHVRVSQSKKIRIKGVRRMDVKPVNRPFIFMDIDMDKFKKDSEDGKEIYRRRLEKRAMLKKDKTMGL